MTGCKEVSIAVGFVTESGMKSIVSLLGPEPHRLRTLVVGLPTTKALVALDTLVENGVSLDNLWIHLGKNKPRHSNKHGAYNYHRFHPMMHSKAFYLDMGGGKVVAIVGSHNLTKFALAGDNCELAIRVEGTSGDPVIAGINEHIMACKAESVRYEPDQKWLYGIHSVRSLEGMAHQATIELMEVDEGRPTLVVLVASVGAGSPRLGDVVYFDLPQDLPVNTIGMEVHLYLLSDVPVSSKMALRRAPGCELVWRCETVSTGIDARTAEGSADWHVPDPAVSRLERTPTPFRPTTSSERRQVFVRLVGEIHSRYEYVFQGRDQLHLDLEEETKNTGEWRLVLGVHGGRKQLAPAIAKAFHETSPDSRNFVLYASRRRKLSDVSDEKL
jgi:hypothetical protein